MKNLIYDKIDYNDRIMLLQLETTNEVPINTNEYNSLYHITVTEIAPNKKLIKCGVKPLQVFNRLVVINSLLSDFTFTTNEVPINTNEYNSLYHITVTEIAPNKKLIKCGVKPLQVFNRLVVINSLLSDFTFTTCYFELLSSKYPLSSLQ